MKHAAGKLKTGNNQTTFIKRIFHPIFLIKSNIYLQFATIFLPAIDSQALYKYLFKHERKKNVRIIKPS